MRFRRIIGTASAVAIMGLGGVVTSAGPAAAHASPDHCNTTFTGAVGGSYTLNQILSLPSTTVTNHDITGCISKDGLILKGSDYTVNLQGKTISARPVGTSRTTSADATTTGPTGTPPVPGTGSTTLSSASANFTAADVGAGLTSSVPNQIAPGAYIVSVTNSTTVVMSSPARATSSVGILTIRPGGNGPGDNAGIHFQSAKRVTVLNGRVTGFDAGVFIDGPSGSSDDIVSTLNVRDNINDALGTAPSPEANCNLGDGVLIEGSSNNIVKNSTVAHNGPYGGVSLVGNSDSNTVISNQILDNNVIGLGGGCGNRNQDEGVRIEGPGANGNRVESNNVERSLLAGISLHGYVGCPGIPLAPPELPTAPNTDNVIVTNTVRGTAGNGSADGIAALAQGPFGSTVCAAFNNTITGNTSVANQGNGIYIPATSNGNTINSNAVTSNGIPASGTPGTPDFTPATGDGILLEGPIFENRFTNVGPSLLDLVQPDQPPFTQCTATPCPAGTFFVLSGSGSGNVTAQLVPVGPLNVSGAPGTVPSDSVTSGCSPSNFVGFPVGAVALIQRGNCDRAQKVNNAVAAGASAVVFFNEGSGGRTGVLTAGVAPVSIPVVGVSYATGQQLFNLTQAGSVIIHVVTNTTNVNTQIQPGASNNTLYNNRGTANAHHDGHDDNPNCDNNIWSLSRFGTVNQACVIANGGTGVVKP